MSTSVIEMSVTNGIGRECTQSGWLWYCDVHDTHGNADFEDEAEYLASAHQEFYDMQSKWNECDMYVWRRSA